MQRKINIKTGNGSNRAYFFYLLTRGLDMFSKFCMTCSEKTIFSSSLRRLGSCFSSGVLSLSFATVAAVLLPSVGSALTLPIPLSDPVFHGVIQHGEFLVFDAPGNYELGGASMTLAGRPPTLSGHAAGLEGLDRDSSRFSASLYYSFRVDPPPFADEDAPPVPVPQIISFRLHTAASGPEFGGAGFAGGTLAVSDNTHFLFPTINLLANTRPAIPTNDSFSSRNIVMLSGQLGFVSMNIFGAGERSGDDEWTAEALFDPYIFIDPAWLLDHPGYSVSVSPGIGNVPPDVTEVPEPATLALVGLALAAMGLSRRHQRKI
jgi:hypothetical protein